MLQRRRLLRAEALASALWTQAPGRPQVWPSGQPSPSPSRATPKWPSSSWQSKVAVVGPSGRRSSGSAFASTSSSAVALPSSSPAAAQDREDGEGQVLLRRIVEQSRRPFTKCTLQDLIQLQELSVVERLGYLEDVLHVGISRIVILLQDMPLGFGSTEPIRGVIRDYVQDLKDLESCSPQQPEQFHACIMGIFIRHKGLIGKVEAGLAEFQREIRSTFKPFAHFAATQCADLSDLVPSVQRIETGLDEFFTIRTTLRLLIAHCTQLEVDDSGIRQQEFSIHLPRVGAKEAVQVEEQVVPKRVGAIRMDSKPSSILIEAFMHAHLLFLREYGRSTTLLVNDMPVLKYLNQRAQEGSIEEVSIPYVDMHLYFVFFEVFRNAMIASLEKAGRDGGTPEPIRASLISGTSMSTENERIVKITDGGPGISREDGRKVWSYFYSTMSCRNSTEGPGNSKTTEGSFALLPGHGLGLGVSRVLMRYFGGEIYLHSIPRKGTDVYIYL